MNSKAVSPSMAEIEPEQNYADQNVVESARKSDNHGKSPVVHPIEEIDDHRDSLRISNHNHSHPQLPAPAEDNAL